ncbi:Na+/melibiose symporter [Parelusimicrobium proximum]|uniref:MFS transporter n=1 Tax=Parelusimicrobium proximum TaxID=3228953 RepID=UPI003D184D77
MSYMKCVYLNAAKGLYVIKKVFVVFLISALLITGFPHGAVEAFGQAFQAKKTNKENIKKLEILLDESVRSQSVPVAMSTAVNKVYAAVELDGEEVSELVNPSALMSYEDFVTWQKGNKAAYERSAEYKKAKAKLELDIRGMLSAGKSAVEIESELGLVGGEEEEEAALKRAYAEYESIVKAEEEEVRAARWYLTEGKWDYKEAWRKEREILQKYADDESLEWSHEDYIYIRKYTQALLGYVKEDVVNRAPRVMSELLSLYKTGVHSEYEHKKGSEEIRELVSAGSAAWCNGKMLEGKEKSKEKAANCAKVSEGAVIIGIIGSPLSGVRGEKEGSEEYLQKYMEEYYDSLAGANVIVNSAVGLLNLGERGVRRLKNVLLNLANKEEIESTKGVFSRGMVGMLAEVGIVGAKGFSDERTIVNGGYYLDGVSKVGSYVDKDLANNREHLINGGAWLEHVLVSNAWEDVGRMIADYEGVDGKGCKECAEVISYAVSKSVSKWGEATTVAGNIPFLVGAAQGSKNIKISDKQKIADGIFGLSFTDLNAANNLALDKKLAYIKGIDAAVYAKGYDIRGKQKSYERSGRIMSGAGVADIVLSVGFAASLARGAVSGARSWVSMFRQASKLKGLGRVPSVRAGISRITVQNLRRAHAQTLLKAPAGRVIPGTERAVNLHNKEISGMKVSVKGAAHNYQNTGSLPKKITPPVRTRATGLKVLEEKPELVAKGNGYSVRKLNDKTLILDLGQRMPGVQPRATGTLTAQAGEGSGGSANSAGPGISTGNVSKYDLLMEVKSTMPKYEPTTVRQPTFRDKFNHVMWQTKMRAAMLSTPVGTTGAVAEGALVTPTQIVSQSKAPASLFDIVESADAARPQRFIGKGTTLVKPQVSALPKSSSAPKTNLLNAGTNRGRGNYHISTPAVTVMAAGYNPLTGRAPYKPTETIHAYANITTPTINYKSDIEALASNKQLNAIITARQSEQGGDVQAEELAGEIVSANAGIRGRVGQIITSTPFKAAASVAALTTLAGAAAGLFAPEAAEGVNTLINNTPDLLPAVNEALPAVNEIPAIAEEIAAVGGITTAASLPVFKLGYAAYQEQSDTASNSVVTLAQAESNFKTAKAAYDQAESHARSLYFWDSSKEQKYAAETAKNNAEIFLAEAEADLLYAKAADEIAALKESIYSKYSELEKKLYSDKTAAVNLLFDINDDIAAILSAADKNIKILSDKIAALNKEYNNLKAAMERPTISLSNNLADRLNITDTKIKIFESKLHQWQHIAAYWKGSNLEMRRMDFAALERENNVNTGGSGNLNSVLLIDPNMFISFYNIVRKNIMGTHPIVKEAMSKEAALNDAIAYANERHSGNIFNPIRLLLNLFHWNRHYSYDMDIARRFASNMGIDLKYLTDAEISALLPSIKTHIKSVHAKKKHDRNIEQGWLDSGDDAPDTIPNEDKLVPVFTGAVTEVNGKKEASFNVDDRTIFNAKLPKGLRVKDKHNVVVISGEKVLTKNGGTDFDYVIGAYADVSLEDFIYMVKGVPADSVPIDVKIYKNKRKGYKNPKYSHEKFDLYMESEGKLSRLPIKLNMDSQFKLASNSVIVINADGKLVVQNTLKYGAPQTELKDYHIRIPKRTMQEWDAVAKANPDYYTRKVDLDFVKHANRAWVIVLANAVGLGAISKSLTKDIDAAFGDIIPVWNDILGLNDGTLGSILPSIIQFLTYLPAILPLFMLNAQNTQGKVTMLKRGLMFSLAACILATVVGGWKGDFSADVTELWKLPLFIFGVIFASAVGANISSMTLGALIKENAKSSIHQDKMFYSSQIVKNLSASLVIVLPSLVAFLSGHNFDFSLSYPFMAAIILFTLGAIQFSNIYNAKKPVSEKKTFKDIAKYYKNPLVLRYFGSNFLLTGFEVVSAIAISDIVKDKLGLESSVALFTNLMIVLTTYAPMIISRLSIKTLTDKGIISRNQTFALALLLAGIGYPMFLSAGFSGVGIAGAVMTTIGMGNFFGAMYNMMLDKFEDKEIMSKEDTSALASINIISAAILPLAMGFVKTATGSAEASYAVMTVALIAGILLAADIFKAGLSETFGTLSGRKIEDLTEEEITELSKNLNDKMRKIDFERKLKDGKVFPPAGRHDQNHPPILNN